MVDEPRITAEQFEREYAQRSGVTVDWLREHGRVVRRCHCGEEECEGWKSVRRCDDWDDGTVNWTASKEWNSGA